MDKKVELPAINPVKVILGKEDCEKFLFLFGQIAFNFSEE